MLGSVVLKLGVEVSSIKLLLILRSVGQRSQGPSSQKSCLTNNQRTLGPVVLKLDVEVGTE